MLRKLTVHGFKSIRQETAIEFGKVNLFIGGNGVGKSNVLEAIGILSACLEQNITADNLNKKGVRLSVPTLFKSAFKNHELRANFDLNAEWEGGINYKTSIKAGQFSEELNFHSELLKISNKKIMGRSPHGFSAPAIQTKIAVKDGEIRPTRGVWDVFQHLLPEKIKQPLQKEFQRLEQFAIYSPQTAFLRGTDIETTTVKPLGLSGGGLPRASSTVLLMMEQFSKTSPSLHALFHRILNVVWEPGWTDQISVGLPDASIVPSQVKSADAALYFIDRYMNTSRNQLSAYDSSEGTLYLLFMVVLMLHPESPKIFAIDNVDSALNPRITRKLLETVILATCRKEPNFLEYGPEQVFLTSHNPTSLDAFDLFDPEQRIFVVMRNPDDGSSQVKRLQPPKGSTKADWIKACAGRNLSEMWIEGKIRGALGL